MTKTQIVITFLEKWILGMAGEIIFLAYKLPNKRSSHLCTTTFNDEKFTTSQGRPFYFQSAVINSNSFLFIAKIFFSAASIIAAPQFSKNFRLPFTYGGLYISQEFFLSWIFSLKLNISLFKNYYYDFISGAHLIPDLLF